MAMNNNIIQMWKFWETPKLPRTYDKEELYFFTIDFYSLQLIIQLFVRDIFKVVV